MSTSDVMKEGDRNDIDVRLMDYHRMEQDPVKVAPNAFKVLLENDRVRVLEIRLKPGRKLPMHTHPPYLVYALTPHKVRVTFRGGNKKEVKIKAGEVLWSDGVSHAVENIGTTEAHVLNIEFKEQQKK